MEKSKILDLAKKLNELAKRGEGGERQNAAEKLQALCEKYGFSLEEIEEEQKQSFIFYLSKSIKDRFINQVMASVSNDCQWFEYVKSDKRGQKRLRIENVTKQEFLEIISKIEFFWNDYNEQMEVFYKAYVQKNKLYRKPKETEEKEEKELTLEEKQELLKMFNMMEGIERKTNLKRLEQ